jgi:putative acetyltransferase
MIAVREDHQGNGVGRRLMDAVIDLAENWLQIARLELFVWTTNHNAVRLYKSLGFEQEGTLRNYAFFAGRYLDANIMARFRQGWRS